MTYHEKVARVMKLTYSAGAFNTYEVILAALHTKFPTEDALRAYVAHLEAEARKFEPDFRLIKDDDDPRPR